MSKPLKTSATGHARITKCLFQYVRSFTSRFTQSHTELDAHHFLVNFRQTAVIRKSQTADANHPSLSVVQLSYAFPAAKSLASAFRKFVYFLEALFKRGHGSLGLRQILAC